MRRADDENDESITRKSMCCCSKDFPTSPTPAAVVCQHIPFQMQTNLLCRSSSRETWQQPERGEEKKKILFIKVDTTGIEKHVCSLMLSSKLGNAAVTSRRTALQ